jgi:phasin
MATAIKKTSLAPGETAAEPTVEKTIEPLSAPVTEAQDHVRKVIEKSVVETRAAYAKAKTAAEEATSAFESSASAAAKGLVAFNQKALDALRANAEANFDFLKSVIGAKSVSEFVALQGEHVRKQADAITAQAKEMAALSEKIAAESVEPIKTQVAKVFKLAV